MQCLPTWPGVDHDPLGRSRQGSFGGGRGASPGDGAPRRCPQHWPSIQRREVGGAFFLQRLQPQLGRWLRFTTFGAPELACATQAALAGGHCRVGFENNVVTAAGAPLRDNADQIGRLAGVLGELGIAPLRPDAVRALFGLKAAC